MAAAAQLTPDAVVALSEHREGQGEGSLKPVLQVVDVRLVNKGPTAAERFRMVLSDGVHTLQSMLSTAANHWVKDGAIVKGTIIQLQEFTCSTIQTRRIVIILKLDILQSECAVIGNPTPYVSTNLPKEQSTNLPAAGAAQNYGGTLVAAAQTYGGAPVATAQTYGGAPATATQTCGGALTTAAQTYGGTPAAGAQPYVGAYSVDPGALGSFVAPRPAQVANNLPYARGGSCADFQRTEATPVDQTVQPVPNVSYGGSSGTVSVHDTLNANVMQSTLQQAPLNSYQNPRFAVPATAGSIVPPGNTYGRSARPMYQQAHPVYMNRGPATKNDVTIQVVPVAQLNPFQSTWTIKVRVTAKSDIRNYNNAKGPGKLFSFELLDAHGGEIKATCFNECVDLFYDKIEVHKVYLISRASLKPTDKRFNTLNHDSEITLNRNTCIQICPDDNSIPRQQYNFRQISELENIDVGSLVDLLGVVTSVSPPVSVPRKDGSGHAQKQTLQKQNLQLKDMSGRSVEITFWEKFCDSDEVKDLQQQCDSGSNPILALKKVRVTDFNGRSLSTISSTQLQVNPQFPEAEKLRHWYETEGKTAVCVSISRENSSMGRNDVRKTVAQIKDEELGRHGKPDWIAIKGSISHVKSDNFCYAACTKMVNGRKCNKKVINNGDGTWLCERCEETFEKCEYRYILNIQIQDHTGVTFATAFAEVGVDIVGCSAEELLTMKENDEAGFAEVIQGIRFGLYMFKVKVAEETFNDEARVKCSIVKAEKLNPSKESGYLVGAIDSILQEDGGTRSEVQGATMSYGTGLSNSGQSMPTSNNASVRSMSTSNNASGQSMPTSNNAYAANMAGAMYVNSSNQFGQHISTHGGLSAPVSAARTCTVCRLSGHSEQNCPTARRRQQPAAASSYGSSPGNAGHEAVTSGFNRQPYVGATGF